MTFPCLLSLLRAIATQITISTDIFTIIITTNITTIISTSIIQYGIDFLLEYASMFLIFKLDLHVKHRSYFFY